MCIYYGIYSFHFNLLLEYSILCLFSIFYKYISSKNSLYLICDENIADCFSITGIYPNPFNKFSDLFTTIRYGLCQETNIQISIYNVNGRLKNSCQ